MLKLSDISAVKAPRNGHSSPLAQPQPTPTATPAPFLRLEGLSKSYREGDQRRVVLQDADATFAQGEFTAILGRSGSGKSTLLNLISGIDRPDAGRIWLDGQELTALDDHRRTLFRRRSIGFVFQFFNLIPTLTVWENVVLPLELNGADPAHARERGQALLAEVGLLDRAATFPDRLSGGEQQRVAIARALVHDPVLVLADEPTGNLDEATGRQVLALLDRLTRQAGKNLIMVTHNPDSARRADRVLHLRNGRLEE
ncbi:MAG: ABC transporter ATP-binding protein [Caldilineales bacterium]|nr:ABC transporter ATP-binding protein [Caldilineales bacterium]MDW8319234.1 ABC transporter ATP-binding protein [Anaerolineae bacterium]